MNDNIYLNNTESTHATNEIIYIEKKNSMNLTNVTTMRGVFSNSEITGRNLQKISTSRGAKQTNK